MQQNKRAGIDPANGVFCPFIFHEQYMAELFVTYRTDHDHIIQIKHPDGFIEFIIWDDMGFAMPGGDDYMHTLTMFNDYCAWWRGNEPTPT